MEYNLKEKFGSRFKSLRISMGLTQEELVSAFKLKNPNYKASGASISQYENGKRIPEVPDLIAWANFFDVTTDYLLGISDIRISHFLVTIKDLEKLLNKLSDNDKLLAKPYIEKLYKKIYEKNIKSHK